MKLALLPSTPLSPSEHVLLDGELARWGLTDNLVVLPPVTDRSKVPTFPREMQPYTFPDLTGVNLILGVGSPALHVLAGERRSLDKWRGSLFWSPTANRKALCVHDPERLQRQFELRTFLRADLRRASEERALPGLQLLQRNIHVLEQAEDVLDFLQDLETGRPWAFDLEGWPGDIRSFALADHATRAWVVPLVRRDGTRVFTTRDEDEINDLLSEVLPELKLIFHHALYDTHVLQDTWQIPCQIHGDTMLQWWEAYSELDKDLGTLASILTREPFYKDERKAEDDQTAWVYNGKDAAVTFECWTALSAMLTPAANRHYQFNLSLLPALLYMQGRGIRLDLAKRQALIDTTRAERDRLQIEVNRLAGVPIPETGADLLAVIRRVCVVKVPRRTVQVEKTNRKGVVRQVDVRQPFEPTNLDECQPYLRKPEFDSFLEIRQLLGGNHHNWANLPDRSRQRIIELLGLGVNLNSPSFNDLLYRTWGLPVQHKEPEADALPDDEPGETHDAVALLRLYAQTKDERLRTCLALKHAITALTTLEAPIEPDGRIRCSYNVVGTDTGRLSCRKSASGRGFNLQTVTKAHRHVYVADPGMVMGQVDLSGADGWTVAAHARALGDSTMWDDYQFGLKPARILALMYERGPEVNGWSRDALKAASKEVDEDGWLYLACKRVQHGSSYLMGPQTMAKQILGDSYKKGGTPVWVEPRLCKEIQENCFFARYPGVRRWHRIVEARVMNEGFIVSASGHKRVLFGRRRAVDKPKADRRTLGAALSEEPQQNTTYATKLALLRLWTDPENRLSAGNLIVEPLHTVHDSLITQWPEDQTAFAVRKHREWFANPLVVAGTTLTIPYSGTYGPDWGMKGAQPL